MPFPVTDIQITKIPDPVAQARGITWEVARLDLLHPVVSGNKLFKLHEFLLQATQTGIKQITTYGGAFSNHLVATAYACSMFGLRSKGYVRGEEPASYSHTLRDCLTYGMELTFLSRDQYRDVSGFQHTMVHQQTGNDELIIPEGGFHPDGARGAHHIMDPLKKIHATHIVLAVGTATTLAGILSGATNRQQVLAIPILKGMHDIDERLRFLEVDAEKKPVIFDQFHFGGYAKYSSELLAFMNDLYIRYQLPTDFVYTAKMMYASKELISNGYFPEGSHILCLHTGGLQGNRSLSKGSLIF